MNNDELRTAIKWTEERIKEVDKQTETINSVREEVQKLEARVDFAKSEIRKVEHNIRWQNNRSRQANTVIARNF